MARDTAEHEDALRDKKSAAHAIYIRLVLPPYTIHFKSSTYMNPTTLDFLDKKVCKEILRRSSDDPGVRASIGTDQKFWADLVVLLKAAIPSLERRSFTIWDPAGVDYESTSGALIASHYPGLWKDLERVNDLMGIARNCLTTGGRVQDLAAQYNLDAEVFRLINCCVRVTARGYDGDAGTGDEEKWQWIVNAYKKLLITSLQFLNNLVAQNERRKLMLWVNLFDNSGTNEAAQGYGPEDVPETSSASLTDVPSNPTSKPAPPLNGWDMLIAFGANGDQKVEITGQEEPLWDDTPFNDYPLPPEALEGANTGQGNGYAFYCKRAAAICKEDYNIERKRDPTLGEMHLEMPRRWAELTDDDHEYWQGLYEDALAKYRQDLAVYEAKMLAVTEQQPVLRSDVPVAQQTRQVERKIAMLEEQLAEKYRHESADIRPLEPAIYGKDGHLTFDNQSLQSRPVVADDMRMLFTAEAGSKILESGKSELMKRLEGYEAPPEEQLPPPSVPRPQPEWRHPDESRLPDMTIPPSRHADGINTRPVKTDEMANPIERTRSMSRTPPILHRSDPRLPENRPENQPPIDLTEEAFEQSEVEESEEEEEEDEEPDEDASEEEEEEEDYPGSTEDGRGLLTDVPLILGPSEIEVLPMLIMSGIVPPPASTFTPGRLTKDETNALLNMHVVRTHLLLSQSNGRNLLRELLIFVAAWDLREEELYFKFMVKIMEAILRNGLMPYAYHAFRDRSRSKDIISPAQAVIMKLLTCIFRARGEAQKAAVAAQARGGAGIEKGKQAVRVTTGPVHGPPINISERPILNLPYMPSRVDLHILNFIFTEFRQHIIPQTCALIFLQGQIHAGRASPEDFPLNLWDMERMYEGVYQYLEFFAVLTEEGVWKGILGEWEMASELVTLLRELEGGIPKMGAVPQSLPRRVDNVQMAGHHGAIRPPQRAMSADAAMMPGLRAPSPLPALSPAPVPSAPVSTPAKISSPVPQAAPVAVERPFEPLSPPHLDPKLPPLPQQPLHVPNHPPPLPPTNNGKQPLYEAETPLAYPTDPADPHQALPTLPPHPANVAAPDQDEPSDFEWRNLKKLTVLVLSSLIWKNRTVQDQVRHYGGLEALVGCCRPDEHNPYIREHAIMCLRFAVEGCEENGRVIRKMAEGHPMNRQRMAEAARAAGAPVDSSGAMSIGGGVTLSLTDAPARVGVADDVPREVLDTQGYETFMDGKGQVGLRRKEQYAQQSQGGSSQQLAAQAGPSGAGVTKPRLSSTKLTAERAAELMSSALSSLPIGDKVRDQGKLEALRKLDGAFEGSGRGAG